MTIREQVDSFYRFANDQLARHGEQLSVCELFDQWRFENPSAQEVEENIAAIQAAIDDMLEGDIGRDAGEIENALRAEFNLPASE